MKQMKRSVYYGFLYWTTFVSIVNVSNLYNNGAIKQMIE